MLPHKLLIVDQNRGKHWLGAAEVGWSGGIDVKWRSRNLKWWHFVAAVAGREKE